MISPSLRLLSSSHPSLLRVLSALSSISSSLDRFVLPLSLFHGAPRVVAMEADVSNLVHRTLRDEFFTFELDAVGKGPRDETEQDFLVKPSHASARAVEPTMLSHPAPPHSPVALPAPSPSEREESRGAGVLDGLARAHRDKVGAEEAPGMPPSARLSQRVHAADSNKARANGEERSKMPPKGERSHAPPAGEEERRTEARQEPASTPTTSLRVSDPCAHLEPLHARLGAASRLTFGALRPHSRTGQFGITHGCGTQLIYLCQL